MLRQIFALLLISPAAMADHATSFSYLQVGHANSHFSCGWSETTHLNGTALTASWQFTSDWFVSGFQYKSNEQEERCTNLTLSVEVQAITAGLLFYSSDRSDWFAKAGWIHREFPGNEHFVFDTAEYYRTLQDRDDAVLSAGARHGIGRYFELAWEAGFIMEANLEPYGAANIRWLPTDRFSIGFQLTYFGDFDVAELNARVRF